MAKYYFFAQTSCNQQLTLKCVVCFRVALLWTQPHSLCLCAYELLVAIVIFTFTCEYDLLAESWQNWAECCPIDFCVVYF